MELELIIEVISKSVLKLQFLKFIAAPKIIAFRVLINLEQVDLLCLSLKLFAEKKMLKNKLFFLLPWKHVKSISLFVVRINKKLFWITFDLLKQQLCRILTKKRKKILYERCFFYLLLQSNDKGMMERNHFLHHS